MKSNALIFRAVSIMIFGLCILSTSQAQTASQQEGSAAPPKIVRKAGGVLQQTATQRKLPVYPPLAQAARVSGAVVVEVTIDEEGKVLSARAVSGHPLLRDAAVDAARGWEFTPTTLSGVPVKVIGTITFNFQQDPEKIENLKKSIAANPGSAELHYELGAAYQANKRNEEAIQEYNQAIQLKPDYAEAYLGSAEIYKLENRYPKALDILKRLISIKPDSVYAYTLMGTLYFKQDQIEEAIEAYKRAIKIDPETDEAHYGLALIYVKKGDKEAAMNEYQILKKMKWLSDALKIDLKLLIDQMQP